MRLFRSSGVRCGAYHCFGAVVLLSTVLLTTVACKTLFRSGGGQSNLLSNVTGGNPQDPHQTYDKAAFQHADRPIRYCLKIDTATYFGGAAGGGAAAHVDAALANAFQTWIQYTHEKGLDLPGASIFPALDISGGVAPDFSGWASRLVKMPSCTAADLAIVFSSDPTTLQSFKLPTEILLDDAHGPLAYSLVSRDDADGKWSRAAIWFNRPRTYIASELPTPNGDAPATQAIDARWTDDNMLRFVMTHEVGHLFGVNHVPRTVMAADSLFRYAAVKAGHTFDDMPLEPTVKQAIETSAVDWGHELQVRLVDTHLSDKARYAMQYDLARPVDPKMAARVAGLFGISGSPTDGPTMGSLRYYLRYGEGGMPDSSPILAYELLLKVNGRDIKCSLSGLEFFKLIPASSPSAVSDLADTTVLTFGIGGDVKLPRYKGEYSHYRVANGGLYSFSLRCDGFPDDVVKITFKHNDHRYWAPLRVILEPFATDKTDDVPDDPIQLFGVSPRHVEVVLLP